MKQIVNLLVVIVGLALVTGATSPSGNDKDMIVRLQGEVLVLQRQIRDLQESIDRSHAVTIPAMEKAAGLAEESSRKLSAIEDRLSQSGAAQSNSVAGVIPRLNRIEEQSSTANRQLTELSRDIKELKSAVERGGSQSGKQP